MTVRGRITVAAVVLAATGLSTSLGYVLGRGLADAPEDMASAGGAPPAVSAPAAPVPVPDALLASVPVAHELTEDAEVVDGRFVLSAEAPPSAPGPLRVETTLDAELTRGIWKILERGRVALGHVVVTDPRTGRILAYVSTDPDAFPPTRAYPAASLIKVITTAAGLDADPGLAGRECRYVGNPYRLSPRRVHPPRTGNRVSMRRALATSNNQCFAQLAVHRVGSSALLEAIDRFGFLRPPAPGHAAGHVEDPGEDDYQLGLLGSGLDGTFITPLHAVQLAGVLVGGLRVPPTWVSHVIDATGNPLVVPEPAEPARVLTRELATDLRGMLVDTTRRGTARKAFRRRGGPLLPGVDVAGKTGSLSGHDPDGRYEWFAGVAPADAPAVAVAVVSVQGPLYWVSASQVAAEVFKILFCPKGVCDVEAVQRWAADASEMAALGAPGAGRRGDGG